MDWKEKRNKVVKYILEEMYDGTTKENKEELKKLLDFVIDQFDLDLYDQCDFQEKQEMEEQDLRELENQEYYLSVLRSLE